MEIKDFSRKIRDFFSDIFVEVKYLTSLIRDFELNALLEYSWNLEFYEALCLLGFNIFLTLFISFANGNLIAFSEIFWMFFALFLSSVIMKYTINTRVKDTSMLQILFDCFILFIVPFTFRTFFNLISTVLKLLSIPFLPNVFSFIGLALLGFYLFKLYKKYSLADELYSFINILLILFVC